MDPQLEKLARTVATEVVEQLSPKLVADVTAGVIEQLAPRLAADVTGRVIEQLGPRLATDVADTVETRQEGRMQVHFERVEGLVKLAAEGYGATLDSIDRRLGRLENKWDTKISDHDRVFANHNERISSLEQKRR